jgi:Sigma-70 region 2
MPVFTDAVLMSSSTAAPEQTALVQGLFVQHLPALRGFVLSLVSDFSLVDDVVQEAFLTVTAKAANFERGTNFALGRGRSRATKCCSFWKNMGARPSTLRPM